jgi:hypothetical protein
MEIKSFLLRTTSFAMARGKFEWKKLPKFNGLVEKFFGGNK